jgi:hypothetical protein
MQEMATHPERKAGSRRISIGIRPLYLTRRSVARSPLPLEFLEIVLLIIESLISSRGLSNTVRLWCCWVECYCYLLYFY